MFRAFGIDGRIVAGFVLFTVIACSAVAGDEPLLSFGVVLSGGYSQATGEHTGSNKSGLHVGGGLQARLSLRRSYAISLLLRADYYRYSDEHVDFVYDTAPQIGNYGKNDGHGSIEADLTLTLLNRTALHPYGLIGLGVRELSGMVCVGVGADLALVSSGALVPFVEFRYSKAELSSVQFDLGIRLGP